MNSTELRTILEREFPPEDVCIKAQTVSQDKNRCLATPYIDARDVAERLTDAFGLGGWHFRWEAQFGDGDLVAAKGSLTYQCDGREITIEDVGYSDDTGPMTKNGYVNQRLKAAVSDALKRCATMIGVGRYLYRLPKMWCAYDEQRARPACANLAELLASTGNGGAPNHQAKGERAPEGSKPIPCPKCLEAGRTGVLKFIKEGVREDGGSYRLWCCSLRKYSKEKGVHGECDYQRWQDPEPTEASGAAEDDTPPIDETPPPATTDDGEQRTRLIVLIRRAAEERLVSQNAALVDQPELLTKKINLTVGEEIRRLVGSVKVLTDLTTAQMAQLLTNLGGDPMAGQ